jgi:hypothetical protein
MSLAAVWFHKRFVVFVVLAFNRHKACLLKLEDGIQDSPRSELKPVIVSALSRSCREQIQQVVPHPGQICPLVYNSLIDMRATS